MSMTSRRVIRVVLFVGIVMAGIYGIWPRPLLLSRVGRRVAVLPGWKTPCYQWRTDRQIFYVHNDGVPVRMGNQLVPTEGPFSIWSVDVVTGQPVEIGLVNRALRSRGIHYSGLEYIIGDCGLVQASPDGKWLLWVMHPGLGSVPTWSWAACRFDGSDAVSSFPTMRFFSYGAPMTRWAWTSNSTHWVALTVQHGVMHALVYQIKPPQLVRDLTLDVTKDPLDRDRPFPTTCLGFAQDGRLLATRWYPGQTNDIALYSFDVSSRHLPATGVTIHLPVPANTTIVNEVVLSPRGNRLAWRFTCLRNLGAPLLARWFAPFAPAPNWRTEIWTSRVDGGDMKEIGHEAVAHPRFPGQELPGEQPELLRWTPDGKRLSYYNHNAIYTVPGE